MKHRQGAGRAVVAVAGLRKSRISLAAFLSPFVASVLAAGCGGEDDGGADLCGALCACMGDLGGADVEANCHTECNQAVAQSATRADCESRLAATGYSACAADCPAESPSADLGVSGGGNAGPRDGDPCSYSSYDCDPSCQSSCDSVSCIDLCCRDSNHTGVYCNGSCSDQCAGTSNPGETTGRDGGSGGGSGDAGTGGGSGGGSGGGTPDAGRPDAVAPPPPGCPDPEHPDSCPAQHGVAADCWTAGTDCSTVVPCGGVASACGPGEVADCAALRCVAIIAGFEASVAACSNGVDDDGNGYIDCEDFHCLYNANVPQCRGETTDTECGNGVDDDHNGAADCEDAACLASPAVTVCGTPERSDAVCGDRADNDGNGYADCRDFSCLGSPVVSVCSQPAGGGDQ